MSDERFYIHCGDDINRQLIDTESDFTIHIEEIYSEEELIQLCNLLNEQQTEIMELRRAIDYLKTVIRYTIPNQMVADVFKYIGEDYE